MFENMQLKRVGLIKKCCSLNVTKDIDLFKCNAIYRYVG